ncbi:molybdopterin-dependent oxidoreductase [Haloplanus sp. GCM10025708]|uniref:molybdopterin-dependent oxidoreductase n=1 Tax=Haloferacaceae TaxID=1644056 RepID=UPI00360B10EC
MADTPIPDEWALDVGGTVDRPLSLDRGYLRSMATETTDEAFSCVHNDDAEGRTWRGVPVGALLARAGPSDTATHGVVHAADPSYACRFPLDRLGGALLALELDGDPIPTDRGGPARLVPRDADGDCWESVKWVTRIALEDEVDPAADTARKLALSR